MKRIQNTVMELSVQDIVEKFKIKNVSALKVTINGTALPNNSDDGSGFEVNADTVRIVLSFETVKAEKAKKAGGRPRKVKPTPDAAASNGTTA